MEKEEIKTYKREIGYRLFIVFVSATVLITVSVAWFANNRQVQANEMAIQPSAEGFEIASEGSKGIYDKNGVLSEGFTSPSETFTTFDGNTLNGFKTSGEHAFISWAVNDSSNMENLDKNSESYLVPGSMGSMKFYIIPGASGELTVNLQLTLQGLKENQDNPGTYIDVDKISQNLLEHHLLLFAGKEDDSYNHWISPDSDGWRKQTGETLNGIDLDYTHNESNATAKLSYDPSNNNLEWSGSNLIENTAYPVTIYWIWPEVLGQFIFADARNNQPTLFPDNYLPDNLFSNMAKVEGDSSSNDYMMWNNSIDSFRNDVTTDNLISLRNGTGNMTVYQKISVYYNRADQYIGENIRYVRLTLDAN